MGIYLGSCPRAGYQYPVLVPGTIPGTDWYDTLLASSPLTLSLCPIRIQDNSTRGLTTHSNYLSNQLCPPQKGEGHHHRRLMRIS